MTLFSSTERRGRPDGGKRTTVSSRLKKERDLLKANTDVYGRHKSEALGIEHQYGTKATHLVHINGLFSKFSKKTITNRIFIVKSMHGLNCVKPSHEDK